MRGDLPDQLGRAEAHAWVIDYEFQRYGRCRVKSTRAPWFERLPGSTHVYPPGTPYWEDTRKRRGRRHSAWVCFKGGEATGLAERIVRREGVLRFDDVTGEIGSALQETARIGRERGDEGFAEAQSVLWRIIALLLQSERHADGIWRLGAEDAGDATPSLVARVQEYLSRNLNRSVRLADIARHAYVSASTLSHRYRAEAGETPMETLTRFRLRHAKALMLRGLPLKAVAAQLGFTDAFHLSKTFKRHEGVSPQGYLRSRRGAAT